MTRWRALAVLGLALLAMTGCRAEGRIEVRSAHAVDVDVTVHGRRSPYCTSDLAGLTAVPGLDTNGVVDSCHYRGTVEPSQFGWAFGVATAGEYITVVFNPFQVPVEGAGGSIPDADQLEAVDITVVLPGQIVENNGGRASGTELRVTDPGVLELPGGLRFAALNHPGPPLWVWWSAGGALVGAASVLGVLWLLRRRTDAGRPPAGPDDFDDDPLADEHGPTPGGDPPEADRARLDEAFRRPADRGEAGHRRGPDPSVWAPDDD